jgi:hypothetical protein
MGLRCTNWVTNAYEPAVDIHFFPGDTKFFKGWNDLGCKCLIKLNMFYLVCRQTDMLEGLLVANTGPSPTILES